MGKSSDLVGKPAPPLELPVIPDGQLYKLPIGEKVSDRDLPAVPCELTFYRSRSPCSS